MITEKRDKYEDSEALWNEFTKLYRAHPESQVEINISDVHEIAKYAQRVGGYRTLEILIEALRGIDK